MERLERDLYYFELQLQGETDRERKILIINQIEEINNKMVEILAKESDRLQAEITLKKEELNKMETDPDANKPK